MHQILFVLNKKSYCAPNSRLPVYKFSSIIIIIIIIINYFRFIFLISCFH